jgi:hypothetical protein
MKAVHSPRWIIIPPCPDRPDWVSALQLAAAEQGLTVADADAGPATSDLIVASDAAKALQAGVAPDNLAVILSEIGILTPEVDSAPITDKLHAAVRSSSELFRRARQLPVERVFPAQAFDAGPVEILPGLTLTRPATTASSTPRNRALGQAIAIYADGQAHWRGEIFNYTSQTVRHEEDRTTIDLTGRPRFLIFGPYVTMPAGRWKAVIRLGFDQTAARYQYRADWGEQETYGSHIFRPLREGVYDLEMEFEWSKPSACEMRLLVLEGAFDGEVSFMGVQLSRAD